MTYKIYQRLATLINTSHSWIDSNPDKAQQEEILIVNLVKDKFPSGSGFDRGTEFNFDESNKNKLVFDTFFHHMNEHGYYDGWTEHKVIVTPCLRYQFDIRVTGRNKNDIKEYIAEAFHSVLNEEYKPEIM